MQLGIILMSYRNESAQQQQQIKGTYTYTSINMCVCKFKKNIKC